MAGVAFDSMGQARGAMGIDAARFRNDETMGIAVGNFANEMTALYVSVNDPLQFFDAAIATGLGPPTRLELTFGIFFFDYDLDGRLDLLSANGHLEEEIHRVQESQILRTASAPVLEWRRRTRLRSSSRCRSTSAGRIWSGRWWAADRRSPTWTATAIWMC